MSTITTPPPSGRSRPWPLYKLSVDQYEAMVESGIFTEHDRLQLINGMLVAKVTQGDDHCVADDLCRAELSAVVPPGWFVRSNKPVRLPPDSEPEPDESVVRGSIRDYERGNAGSLARRMSAWSWKWPTPAWPKIGRWSLSTAEAVSPSIGS